MNIERGHFVRFNLARGGHGYGEIVGFDKRSRFAAAYGTRVKLDSGSECALTDIVESIPLYVSVTIGLRGCYMPDNAATIMVRTLSELREYIEDEARDLRDAGFSGANKHAVRVFTREVWERCKRVAQGLNDPGKGLETVLPYGYQNKPGEAVNYSHAIGCAPSTESEFREYRRECGDCDDEGEEG